MLRTGDKASPLHGERGITLLEMLVVAAIIGLIVGISFSSATTGLDSARLASATQSVASFLNGGVTRADRRQQPVELVISPKDNLLTLYSTEPGFTRELKLPEGVAIEAVLPEEPGEQGGVRRFVLMPNSAAPAISIQVGNSHGARRIVQLDPMTGFPRVKSVAQK